MHTFVWVGVALLLTFWAVGAYNRLMRTRQVAQERFRSYAAAQEKRLAVLLRIAHAALLHRDDPNSTQYWEQAEAKMQLLANALARAVTRVQDAERMEALLQVHQEFDASWRAARDASADLAGVPWPREMQDELALCDAAVLTHHAAFDSAVAEFNDAIAQWPTRWLAQAFGFGALRSLVPKDQ
jgi:LemA protein